MMQQQINPTYPDGSIDMAEVTFNAIKSKSYLAMKNPLKNDETFFVEIKEEERYGKSVQAINITKYISEYSFQYILKSCEVDYVG